MAFDREDLDQIMEIFRAESDEHIQNLSAGFLELEKKPKNIAVIDEVFREAHSLKGAARMMGFSAIENVSHKIEGVLSMARRGELVLDTRTIDLLYRGLDAISQIIEALAKGELETSVPIDEVVAPLCSIMEGNMPIEMWALPDVPGLPISSASDDDLLNEAEVIEDKPSIPVRNELNLASETPSMPADLPETKEIPANISASPAVGIRPNETRETAGPVEEGIGSSAPDRRKPEHDPDPWERRAATIIGEEVVVGRRQSDVQLHQTIRVATQRLDELMNQVGELLTIRIKTSQRIVETQTILENLEEWARRWHARKEHQLGSRRNDGHRESTPAIPFFGQSVDGLNSIISMLNDLCRNLNEDNLRLTLTTDELKESVKKTRMMPISTTLETFPRMVRDLAKECAKEVELVLDGVETELDKKMLEMIKDPLVHLVRNAVDHGLETPQQRRAVGKPEHGTVGVRAIQRGNTVAIEVTDDGSGLDTEQIRETALRKNLCSEKELLSMTEAQIWNLIFAPAFSTSKIITNVSGRGIGMDVVRTNVEQLKGLINVESKRGRGTCFAISLPLTLATTDILLVEASGTVYALPTTSVETTARVKTDEIFTVAGRTAIDHNGYPIALARLSDALDLAPIREDGNRESVLVVVVGSVERRVAFVVDRLVGEEQVVVKSLGGYLRRVRGVSGATTLGDGRICLILNVADLIRAVQRRRSKGELTKNKPAGPPLLAKVLVVDDSITTRTLERNILEAEGFRVTTAVDGFDALAKIHEGDFSAIISDVEMPNMDGFELAERIRCEPNTKDLPFILVTSLESDEDKRRGIEVGANAYLTKSTFDQSHLLDTIKRLV